ncbi:hypothetical protein HPB49_015329 [Dermacentor silvarum]|uniref:Uncharacterized protein n=1 Tax=Dermacentor silvarum TaxID=543639 RepID=A0ACB8E1G5_DERSI|nr:hypothetical protein HPB49_015329 [Dermacentor silvarum]
MTERTVVAMEGDDLPPEEFCAEHGWRSAAVKKNALRVPRRDSTREPASSEGHREHLNGSRKPISLKNKIIKSSRMPQLPKEHWKIIGRAPLGLVGPSLPRQDSRLSQLATTSSAPMQHKTSSS